MEVAQLDASTVMEVAKLAASSLATVTVAGVMVLENTLALIVAARAKWDNYKSDALFADIDVAAHSC